MEKFITPVNDLLEYCQTKHKRPVEAVVVLLLAAGTLCFEEKKPLTEEEGEYIKTLVDQIGIQGLQSVGEGLIYLACAFHKGQLLHDDKNGVFQKR